MRMNNNWHIVQLQTDTTKSDETDLLELKKRQLENITASIASKTKVGNFGAIATSDNKYVEGYWINEWKSTLYYDDETGQQVFDVNWMYSLNYTPSWYHKHTDGPTFDTVLVHNVV